MTSRMEAITSMPRDFCVIKIGKTTESLINEEDVLKYCEGVRKNLIEAGLRFGGKLSFYFETRDAGKEYLRRVLAKNPPPVFIIVDDFDAKSIDGELSQNFPGAIYFTGYLLRNCSECALKARCGAFVETMSKLWCEEIHEVKPDDATLPLKCSSCGSTEDQEKMCKCIAALIDKIQEKHVCGYDNLAPELYAMIKHCIGAKEEDTKKPEPENTVKHLEKELEKVDITSDDKNDHQIDVKEEQPPVNPEPTLPPQPTPKPSSESSVSPPTAVSPSVSKVHKTHKSISSTIFEIGPNYDDLLKLVHEHSWTMKTLFHGFENNCRQAQNMFGSKKPTAQITELAKINMMIRDGLKYERGTDENIVKCWAIVLVYHAKILRMMMTCGNSSVDLERAVCHPRLYRAIRYALEDPNKFTPNEIVHVYLGNIIEKLGVAVKEHELEDFLLYAFVHLHRVAIVLAIVYLSHQLSKCASNKSIECHDVKSEGDLRLLIAVTKAALTADEHSIAQKTGEFFATWQRIVCAGLPELKEYKLLHFCFKPDLSMPF